MLFSHQFGQNDHLQYPFPDLEIAVVQGAVAGNSALNISRSISKDQTTLPGSLIAHMVSWIGGANRQVEIWSTPTGSLLRVEGGSDFYLTPAGQIIVQTDTLEEETLTNHNELLQKLSALDREIFLGPALVVVLAMRDTWSFHASAAICQNQSIAFLGESGQGKSTLAAYLSNADWQRVADDILPVSWGDEGAKVWPHFPQLKLPMDKQPGLNIPEQLPLDKVCLLEKADAGARPDLKRLPPNQAVRVLLGHTAGSRLFGPDLLARHLDFCARVSEQIPTYHLSYPHREDVLPEVKELLENIC